MMIICITRRLTRWLYAGGDCHATAIPFDSEAMEEEHDYPYKYLQDSHEVNNNGLKLLNILRNKKSNNSPLWSGTRTSTVQALLAYNLSTISKSPNLALNDLGNTNLPRLRRDANVQSDDGEDGGVVSTRNVHESLYSRRLSRRSVSDKSTNRTEHSKRSRLNDDIVNPARFNGSAKFGKFAYSNQWRRNTRGLDTYAESLLYVNKIYNAVYGLERRRVPAHMPHLIDKWIVASMQQKFETEFRKTSSHRVRDSEDMQFAFSYFYFLSSEKRSLSIEEIFDVFDTDKSQ